MGAADFDKLTRQELYDRLWSTSTTKLAPDFGISDVGLAKRCKALNVPRPPRGHWAQIAAGHKPRKTPLPPAPKTDRHFSAHAINLHYVLLPAR